MSSEVWVNYVIVVVVILTITVIALLILRNRTSAGRILDNGWQFYFTPTTLEPPGTVFRIDDEGRRYIVTTLAVKPQTGKETFGESTESFSASMGFLVHLLGIKDANLKYDLGKKEKIVFKMENPEREIVTDVELDDKLFPFLKKLEYRVDNRYFVIRECRKATGITHHLTQGQVSDLGGNVSLSNKLAVNGSLLKAKAGSEFLLKKKFDRPLRVMFLPEEIKPISAGLAGEEPILGRVPVRDLLEWKDS